MTDVITAFARQQLRDMEQVQRDFGRRPRHRAHASRRRLLAFVRHARSGLGGRLTGPVGGRRHRRGTGRPGLPRAAAEVLPYRVRGG